jgi:thiol-disulfide isomerase/thioredoxin
MMIHRRILLATAAGTLAATVGPRKPLARTPVTGTFVAETLAPLSEGLDPVSPPQDPPDAAFLTQDGTEHHLSEFKGRGMVVNMWATWCAPCVAEMPSLEALSKALAPHDIAVLPLSSDRGGADAVQAWYQAHGITLLPVLLDPRSAMARAFNARGIPTTVIINTGGKVVARLEGAADWSAPEGQALVRKLAGT